LPIAMDDHALRFGSFRLDPVRRVLLNDGVPVRIGPRATSLLLVLVERRRSVVSKAELFDLVWPGLVVEENNLQQHISALRKLFGPQAIVTVPGRGYLFALAPEGEPLTALGPAPDPAAKLDVVPAAAPPMRPTPLPANVPLIGRETERGELLACVRAHAVVTVVGPGGIGKTRLALAVAHACQADFAGGVWLTDLSVLTDGGQVAATVAHALGIVLPAEPAAVGAHAATMAAALRGQDLLLVLDMCERLQAPLAVRFAALCHDLGKGSTPRADWPRHRGHEDRSAKLADELAKRWRVPSDCRELALIVAREHTHVHTSAALGAAALMRLLERCDALRRPERFAQVLLACECDARGRAGLGERAYAQGQRLERALAAARAVDATLVAAQAQQRGLVDAAIGQAIHAARVRAVEEVLGQA